MMMLIVKIENWNNLCGGADQVLRFPLFILYFEILLLIS